MNKLKRIWQNGKETLLYLIFGVLTTLVDYIVALFLFHSIGLGELTANNFAWCASVIFAYVTNKLFVFESKSFQISILLREIITFVSARVVTLLMADVIIWIAAKWNISFFISKMASSVIVVIANYIFSKLIIFRNKPNQEEQ